MGTFRIFIDFILLLAVASGQQSPNGPFRVEGLVVDSLNGKPLPRVEVQLRMIHPLRTTTTVTGSGGEFSFDGIPSGTAEIIVSKPGYLSPGPVTDVPHRNIVHVGPDSGKVVLQLEPEAVISGHVIGANGNPVEGADIRVLAVTISDGWRKLRPGPQVVSDEEGNFSIPNLASGRYYLALKTDTIVGGRVVGATSTKPSQTYPALVYYPRAVDLAAAVPLDVISGKKIELEFSLTMVAAYTVSGRVMATGEWKQWPWILDSLRQALVFKAGDRDYALATSWEEESGAFTFSTVPAGTYTLLFFGPDPQTSTMKLTVANDISDLKLFPKPFPNIEVMVRTEFGKLAAAASCTHDQANAPAPESGCSLPAAWVNLLSPDDGDARFGTGLPSPTMLRGVEPGKYLVQPVPRHGGYVQAVRSGSRDLLREPLIVPEDGTVAPIEVVLRDDAATIKVTALADKPLQEVHVLAFPQGTILPALRPVTGYSGKEISLPPMAPGTYKVLAFDSLEGLEYNRPEILAKYDAKAATVTVGANQSLSVAVELVQTER